MNVSEEPGYSIFFNLVMGQKKKPESLIPFDFNLNTQSRAVCNYKLTYQRNMV